MTSSVKWIIAIIVLIIVAGGAYYWYSMPRYAVNVAPSDGMASTTSATSSGQQTPEPSGDSNAALEQSAAQIDTQISGFNSDDSNINSGLNDEPVQQSSL